MLSKRLANLEDEKMRLSALCFFLLVACFAIGCNRNPIPQNNNEISKGKVPETKEQKPNFPGLTPESYVIPIDEPTFIQVVTNSTQMQEVWMVYYDSEAQKWVNMPLGKGSGENNHIIGDIKFEKRYGFGRYYENPPEFYMRYSDDEGHTWKTHKIERAQLNCDARGKDPKINRNALLLVSWPLNPKSNLPDVAIVLQWSKPSGMHLSVDRLKYDFKNLCEGLKEIPLVAR
jgi:hypothetical protein